MDSNVRATEKVALVATLDPVTVVNVEQFSDVVDMSKYHQIIGIAMTGNMAAETIDFKVYTCDSNGSNATVLKAATQLAAHATNNDGVQIIIGVRPADLVATSKQYVKFGLVTGNTTGGPAAVAVLAVDIRQGLAANTDLSSVVELKN